MLYCPRDKSRRHSVRSDTVTKRTVHDNYHDGVHDRTIVYEHNDGSKRIVDQRVHDSLVGELAVNTGERREKPSGSNK